MAFPQTPLPLLVELRLGTTWTDVTTRVRAEQQIRIQRGRSDWGQQVDSTRCTFTLANSDGRYTPGNPTGPYYGLIGRNTPCRVSVLAGPTFLDLPGSSTGDYAQSVDDPALDITGDIDVRIDMALVNWLAGGGGTVELLGKMSGTGQKSWMLGTRGGRLYFEWSPDGTAAPAASSTVPPVIPGSGGRMAVRATLDVDNGASGNTVRFYTAPSLAGPWTQLGDPIVQAGTTSIFNSASPVRIGNATGFGFAMPVGRCHAVEIRSGIGGTAVANPSFTGQATGTASFVDGAGRTWTMNGACQITNRRTRFVGEVSAWNVRWQDKFDVVTAIEAAGITRRMGQGASPVQSSMRREFSNPARRNIIAYWPMEDEAAATEFGSAMDGHAAMRLPSTGGVTPAAYSGWPASAALPTYSYGTTKAVMPPSSPTGFIFSRLFVDLPTGGVSGTDRLLTIATSGTARTWAVFVNTGGGLDLRSFDADGNQLSATGFTAWALNGRPVQIAVELTQDGADVDYTLYAFYTDTSTLTRVVSDGITGTVAGQTLGAAVEARIGQLGLLNGTAVGHLAVADNNNAFANTLGAMIAWNGEGTWGRLYRLGLEELSPVFAASSSDEQMGVQGMSTLLDLLDECADAEEGILVESREWYPSFRFRDRASLYNQTPGLVLGYSDNNGPLVTPLDPVDDDQQVRNDRTVQRKGGSSTRRTLDSGPLSTQAPPNGVGRYDDSTTENLFEDDQTGEHAGWLLHLGTVDETRYPLVKIKLAKAPALIEDAADLDLGDRMQITTPPPWLPPDTIDLMVQGYTETLDQFTWDLDFNCTPAAPWDVTWLGSLSSASAAREFAWIDTDGSQLAEALTTTETDVDVLTTAGPLWTPFVRDTPVDWRVAGEVMTVTAPGGLLNSNPFFDTDMSGWTGQNASIARTQAAVCPHPRATASLLVTPNGSGSVANTVGALTPVGSITPGAPYVASMWVYSPGGWADLRPVINWHDASSTYLSTSSGSTVMPVPAGQWVYLEQTLTAPASASRAAVLGSERGTPGAGDVYYVWAPRVTRATSSWLRDAFSRTSSSGWGTADTGNVWLTVGGGVATDYTVSGAYASHILSTVDTTRRTGIAAPHADVDIYCDITTSAAATGDSLYGAVCARMLDANNLYMARLEFTTGNAINLTVREMVAGVQTQLGSLFTLPFTHSPGTFVRVRFQLSGSTLRARAWRASDPEPDVWRITTTDTSLTAAQQIGTRSVRVTGNTNTAAVEIRYENYELINPQTYTVTRSANRVVKTQSAGAAVALARPAILAL
ncbi:carbohydrate binding domain-containing protein [Streptomyces sp. NPDC088789]|uniref:carbohydrate binding domain-containing protein n=1 Tax=Streptomyces sp. NPDC088789 TaxID=3365899 RepID=UPI003820556F